MARKDITMDATERRSFLEEGAKHVIVTTMGPDGWPHVTPLWYVLEGDEIAFRSFRKAQRIVNLQRDPRMTALVEDGDEYANLRGVMIQATARLVDDPAYCLDLYVRLAGRYRFFPQGAPEMSESDLREAFGRHATKNIAVIVEPRKIVSWDHTKLGGAY
jgi:PPOX class probable F420-dependent enzyme